MTGRPRLTRRSLLKRAGAAGAAVALGGAFVLDRVLESEDEGESLPYLSGFNDDFLTYSTQDLASATMDRVAACGGRCVRFGVDWGLVQAAGPDQYDWSTYDFLYVQALDAGIQLLPTVTGCPDWADPVAVVDEPGRPARVPPAYFRSCSPERDGDFGRFVDQTLRHFDAISKHRDLPPVVSAVEILNEPNIWHIGEMPPARLRELATAAAAQVAASQEAGAFSGPMRVISGGLASLTGLAEGYRPGYHQRPTWYEYLAELVEGGPAGFDVGFHSYEIAKPPASVLTVPEDNPADPFARGRQFAEWQASRIVTRIYLAAVIARTDIWVTETGASSASTWSTDIFSPGYRAAHGEAIQAEALSRVAEELKSRPEVKSMLVHRLYSNDAAEPPPTPTSNSPHYQDGVYESIGGRAKAAVAALTATWT